MALIERLMGLAADGISPAPTPQVDPTQSRIQVHTFTAACFETAFGPRTVAEIKGAWSMDPAAASEFDALIAKVTGTDAVKHRMIFQFEQVLMLAEEQIFYTTPALVRARLGI